MSSSTFQSDNRAKAGLKRAAQRLIRGHIPVGAFSQPIFNGCYRLHVATRFGISWAARFLWYEPLFRSQCASLGERFVMEQLPYVLGRGTITIGRDVRFSGKPSFAFSSRHCPSPLLSIGDGCFLGHNTAVSVARSVQIGNHCLIAGGVRISDFDGHPIDAIERRSGATTPSHAVRPVLIGDDVWLGHGALILKGVTIGDRSIVGARSVVTRDVEPDTVVAGNPARAVKSLESSPVAA